MFVILILPASRELSTSRIFRSRRLGPWLALEYGQTREYVPERYPRALSL